MSPLNSLAIRLELHPAPEQELTEDEVYDHVNWLITREVDAGKSACWERLEQLFAKDSSAWSGVRRACVRRAVMRETPHVGDKQDPHE